VASCTRLEPRPCDAAADLKGSRAPIGEERITALLPGLGRRYGECVDTDVTANEPIRVTDNVSVTKRSYYSIGWLTTANIMKTHAEEIGRGESRPIAPAYAQLRSCVLSALTASAAFLEAGINELFEDAVEYLASPRHEALRGLDQETQVRLAALWPHVEMQSVMVKYDIALDVANADPLDHGTEPAQSVGDLVKVRNHFIHYRPISVRDGVAKGNDKKLSDRLRQKIELPLWDNGGEDLFPTRVICPDLARWAVESAVSYADVFSERLGIKPAYDHVRPD